MSDVQGGGCRSPLAPFAISRARLPKKWHVPYECSRATTCSGVRPATSRMTPNTPSGRAFSSSWPAAGSSSETSQMYGAISASSGSAPQGSRQAGEGVQSPIQAFRTSSAEAFKKEYNPPCDFYLVLTSCTAQPSFCIQVCTYVLGSHLRGGQPLANARRALTIFYNCGMEHLFC